MGMRTELSLSHTLPGACGLSSPGDDMRTLLGRYAHSPGLHTLSRYWAHSPVGTCGLRSLQDEVWTLPGPCTQSLVGAHTPLSLGTLPRLVPVVSASSKMKCRHSLVGAHRLWWVSRLPNQCACSRDGLVGGWRGDWSCCCREFPKVPLSVFFFLGKSSCSILPLPPTNKGLSSHTVHLSS